MTLIVGCQRHHLGFSIGSPIGGAIPLTVMFLRLQMRERIGLRDAALKRCIASRSIGDESLNCMQCQEPARNRSEQGPTTPASFRGRVD
jgi:hypothetical protein